MDRRYRALAAQVAWCRVAGGAGGRQFLKFIHPPPRQPDDADPRLAFVSQNHDNGRVSNRAQDHLRADPVMARLIDRLSPVKLRARRLPPF